MRTVLLCLHGWGGAKESFTELREALRDAPIDILTPDLPGFGSEPEPKRPWTNDDYADWVEKFIKSKLSIVNDPLSILAHSHGGRIALKIVTRRLLPVEHLYLCAAAGIRHPRHWRRIAGLILAKIGNTVLSIPGLRSLQPLARRFLYRLIRIHDYEKASPLMRETLIKITAEDFRPILPFVTVPTDIFWGEDDRMTPISDGLLIHEQIRGSSLHRFPGVRHSVHRDQAREIAAVIRAKLAPA